MKRGWFNESWRHSLARKGVATVSDSKRYFADMQSQEQMPPPNVEEEIDESVDALGRPKKKKRGLAITTKYKQLQTKRLIEAEEKTQMIAKRTGSVVLEQVRGGNLGALKGVKLNDVVGKVYDPAVGFRAPKKQGEAERAMTADDVVALRAAVGQALVDRVTAGESVDNDLVNQMNPQVKKQVVDLQKSLKPKGAARLFAEEKAVEGLAKAEAKIGRTEAEVRRERLDKAMEDAQLRRLEEEQTAGFSLLPQKDTDAVFIDESYGGPFTNPLNPFRGVPGMQGPPERFQAFDVFNQVGASKAAPKVEDFVQKEVDALFGSRFELGKVDKKPFVKGKSAFEKGDFEGVVDAMAKMQEQRKQQEQRKNIVFQTRQLVDSPRNREVQLRGSNDMVSFLHGGGSKIADQTRKIAETHALVQKGYEEAYVRENVLKQMASQLKQKPAVPEARSPPVVDVVRSEEKPVWREVGDQLIGEK